jgi:hypothetical protein
MKPIMAPQVEIDVDYEIDLEDRRSMIDLEDRRSMIDLEDRRPIVEDRSRRGT